jgi:hypothetical protein
VDLLIADCQLRISDWRLPDKANWQSQIENRQSDPPATAWGYLLHVIAEKVLLTV